MPLGQTHPSRVPHQFAMEIFWNGILQCADQKKLPSRGLQQIRSAHHFGDPHRRVIDHDCQLIGRNIIPAPHQKIAEVTSRDITLPTLTQIGEFNFVPVRHPKAPVHARRLGKRIRIGAPTAPSWIDRLVVAIVIIIIGRARGLRQILSRTCARVNQSAIAQLPPGVEIETAPFALQIRTN